MSLEGVVVERAAIQNLDAYQKTGKLQFTGFLVPPEPHEAGWKDMVRAEVLFARRF